MLNLGLEEEPHSRHLTRPNLQLTLRNPALAVDEAVLQESSVKLMEKTRETVERRPTLLLSVLVLKLSHLTTLIRGLIAFSLRIPRSTVSIKFVDEWTIVTICYGPTTLISDEFLNAAFNTSVSAGTFIAIATDRQLQEQFVMVANPTMLITDLQLSREGVVLKEENLLEIITQLESDDLQIKEVPPPISPPSPPSILCASDLMPCTPPKAIGKERWKS